LLLLFFFVCTRSHALFVSLPVVALRQRIVLRLVGELYLVGVCNDTNVLVGLLKEIVRFERLS
jgi:hypothetical protein